MIHVALELFTLDSELLALLPQPIALVLEPCSTHPGGFRRSRQLNTHSAVSPLHSLQLLSQFHYFLPGLILQLLKLLLPLPGGFRRSRQLN